MKKSGILMHISTLPGDYGCGSFGDSAYSFIDLLAESGFTIWQTLPFSWPDEYGSPYKALSAFAGNPYFIDLPTLAQDGLLTEEELAGAKQTSPYLCEFERLFSSRLLLLAKAASRVTAEKRAEIEAYIENSPHLSDFCNFMAKKEANHGAEWQEFDPDVDIDPDVLFLHKFIQYTFYTQWSGIKAYANERGIEIIGDVPIYLDLDSSDVYANPDEFLLDAEGHPTDVAGVPPDYFSPDGQLWGNPLYNWKAMKKDGYRWWLDRIEHLLTIFDGVRIDHFRAFSAYWSVPAESETAKAGRWVKGPGLSFVNLLKKQAGDRLIIAEDLGDIDEDVFKLLEKSKLPGMRVFQFAFLSENSPHMPHNYPENCVAYSGTHDNNTLLGYIWESDDDTRQMMMDYIGYPAEMWQSAVPAVLKTLLRSSADRVVFPIQDILGYGVDTRMNVPGVKEGNWAFRLTEEQLDGIDRGYWNYINRLYGRGSKN